ncbi:hypothetical protein MPSEU_000813400 [Mayamaea pseudoterrestris]|nr:hypothetical protein MPSEU_000813400 [Mayamaea pseudoterrestris]
MSESNMNVHQAAAQSLFGDSSDDEEMKDPQPETESTDAAASDAAPAAATNKELFGDSDSDDDDDENLGAKESAAAVTTSHMKQSNHDNSDDDDEGDVEFDDAGAIVGLASSTIAGQVSNRSSNERNEESTKKSAPPKLLHWTIAGNATRPSASTKLIMTKLPNLVGIQTQPFDANRYDPDEEEAIFGGAVHNLMRWRYKRDENKQLLRNSDDELMRESNTRLVEWEDGSWTMHVGAEAFEVEPIRSAANASANPGFANGFLFLSHANTTQQSEQAAEHDDDETTPALPKESAGTILEGMGNMHQRWKIKPAGLQSQAHKALTLAVRRKTIQTGRMATVMTQNDPEKLKADRIKIQTELARAKERSKRPFASGGAGGGGGNVSRRPRMSRSYLEGGEDDARYDSVNIRAMKKGARDYGDDDQDDDDFGDDFIDNDEEDDEIFNRQKPSKQAKGAAASKTDMAMDVDDDDDEEEETFVKKSATKKKASVFDDDDSD